MVILSDWIPPALLWWNTQNWENNSGLTPVGQSKSSKLWFSKFVYKHLIGNVCRCPIVLMVILSDWIPPALLWWNTQNSENNSGLTPVGQSKFSKLWFSKFVYKHLIGKLYQIPTNDARQCGFIAFIYEFTGLLGN